MEVFTKILMVAQKKLITIMSDLYIIDYRLNNTRSVYNSIKKLGFEASISRSPSDLKKAKKIILPGVGSFDVAMKVLIEEGWDDALLNCMEKNDVPLLGICLGMQLLSNSSTEGNGCKGLGLIKGKVSKIKPKESEKIPHIGWNSVNQVQKSPLFNNIPNGCDFYFVHSYKFEVQINSDALGKTPFSGEFTSVINNSNVFGVQFHPEKSSKYGLKILDNFLKID